MNIVIDNYDSFTYNLVQYIGEVNSQVKVFKNDEIDIDHILKLNPEHIIISPGPGRPENSGVSLDIINQLKTKIPILGICLGHQAIAYSHGAKIINADNIYHGKTSEIYHNGDQIFSDIEDPFIATRYHSLVIDKESLNKDFEIIAWTESEVIMGIRHQQYPLYGLQFHPESVLTYNGFKIIKNFLNENIR